MERSLIAILCIIRMGVRVCRVLCIFMDYHRTVSKHSIYCHISAARTISVCTICEAMAKIRMNALVTG